MDNKKIRQIIKNHISDTLKEQTTISFKASDNNPDNSCTGRGVCCVDFTTQSRVVAPFKILPNKRVICRCPQGTRKIMCEK